MRDAKMALLALKAALFNRPKREQVAVTNITVANTTTETDIITPLVFPIGYFSVPKAVEIKLAGFLSGTNGDGATVRVYLGATKLIESAGSMPNTFTNTGFMASVYLTGRASGKVIGQGSTTVFSGVGLSTAYNRPLTMLAEATINTALAQTLRITYQWGAAKTGDTLTVTNANIFSANA